MPSFFNPKDSWFLAITDSIGSITGFGGSGGIIGSEVVPFSLGTKYLSFCAINGADSELVSDSKNTRTSKSVMGFIN